MLQKIQQDKNNFWNAQKDLIHNSSSSEQHMLVTLEINHPMKLSS